MITLNHICKERPSLALRSLCRTVCIPHTMTSGGHLEVCSELFYLQIESFRREIFYQNIHFDGGGGQKMGKFAHLPITQKGRGSTIEIHVRA